MLKQGTRNPNAYRPTSLGFCPDRFRNMKPAKQKLYKRSFTNCEHVSSLLFDRAITHFDVELRVFIHGVNVVEDVLDNSRNDSHHFRVMKFSLRRKILREKKVRNVGRIHHSIIIRCKLNLV